MMNILVYGGSGTIGKPLVQELRKRGDQVFIVDEQGVLEDEDDTGFRGCLHTDVIKSIVDDKITVIVNLAEDASLSTMHTTDPFYSLYETAEVLQFCATYKGPPVTTLLGLWYTQSHKSNFQLTSSARSNLPDRYNKGSVVVTPVYIPNIIAARQPVSNFQAVVNRVLQGIFDSKVIMFTQAEYTNPWCNWSDVNTVVQHIANLTTRRTREIYNIPYHPASIQQIISYVLDELNIDAIEVHYNRDGSLRIPRNDLEPQDESEIKLREWISTAIGQFISDNKEDDPD